MRGGVVHNGKGNYDYLYKTVLIGDTGVGKSNLLSQFVGNKFDQKHATTLGIEFAVQNMQIDGKTIKTQIWDTSGMERFRCLAASFYRGARGALLVYDITDAGTFDHVNSWLQELKKSADPDILTLVVGNKSDLTHLRSVHTADAKDFCQAHNLSFIETSALTAANVERAFEILLTQIYQREQKHAKKLHHDTLNFRLSGPTLKGSAVLPVTGDFGSSAPRMHGKKFSCCA